MRSRTRPPIGAAIVILLAAVAGGFFALPLIGIVLRAPWTDLVEHLSRPAARTAFRLSLVSSSWATVISIALGVPLAWVLARVPFRGKRFVRAFALVPLVLPPVVGGVALLLAFGRDGLIGRHLDAWFGVALQSTTAGAAVAAAFVAMPFLVITSEAAFRSADRKLEDAARTMGATAGTVFRRVTLPLTWPALAAGVVLAWARALGEFGATVTFAGSVPGRTTTIPIEVYALLDEEGLDAAIALSMVLLLVSVAVLGVMRDRWVRAR